MPNWFSLVEDTQTRQDYHPKGLEPKGLEPKGLEPKGSQATNVGFVSGLPETGLQPQVVNVSGPQFRFEPKRRRSWTS